jgi:hypothetical protein
MTNNIQSSTNFCTEVFTATQNVLTAYDWEQLKAYPTPALVAMVSTKITTTPQRLKDLGPLVQFFIHDSSDYYIGVGAKGGVQRVADRDAKVNRAAAKAFAKQQLQAKLEEIAEDNTVSANDNQDTQ